MKILRKVQKANGKKGHSKSIIVPPELGFNVGDYIEFENTKYGWIIKNLKV